MKTPAKTVSKKPASARRAVRALAAEWRAKWAAEVAAARAVRTAAAGRKARALLAELDDLLQLAPSHSLRLACQGAELSLRQVAAAADAELAPLRRVRAGVHDQRWRD